jgi:hypothetical protein
VLSKKHWRKITKEWKTEKSKGTHFPFPLSYDPPIEGHRQACPAKFISDSYCRAICSAFEQMGGQTSQLPGSNFREVFSGCPILPISPDAVAPLLIWLHYKGITIVPRAKDGGTEAPFL